MSLPIGRMRGALWKRGGGERKNERHVKKEPEGLCTGKILDEVRDAEVEVQEVEAEEIEGEKVNVSFDFRTDGDRVMVVRIGGG